MKNITTCTSYMRPESINEVWNLVKLNPIKNSFMIFLGLLGLLFAGYLLYNGIKTLIYGHTFP